MPFLAFLAAGYLKREENHKHEQKMGVETNRAALDIKKEEDATTIKLAELEAKLKEKELKNELEIAKIQAESMNKKDIDGLRNFANSRQYANSGNSRGRGNRPWA